MKVKVKLVIETQDLRLPKECEVEESELVDSLPKIEDMLEELCWILSKLRRPAKRGPL